MRYLGGKTRLVPFLSAAIRSVDRPRYIEPFVGGGSVLAGLASHFDTIEAGDLHPDLTQLWNAVLNGWEPPALVTEAEYADLRLAPPSPLRAYAGFACSFGGKWFGGYARKSDGTADQSGSRASLLRKGAQMRAAGVDVLRCASFEDYKPTDDAVVYCDPPYVTSADYSTGTWRPYDFWDAAREWAEAGAVVLVSEFQAPRDFVPVAETDRSVSIQRTSGTRARASERLFAHRATADALLADQPAATPEGTESDR